MNIHDHGENDPIAFELSEGWQAIAKFGREAIEAQRQARNEDEAFAEAEKRMRRPA